MNFKKGSSSLFYSNSIYEEEENLTKCNFLRDPNIVQQPPTVKENKSMIKPSQKLNLMKTIAYIPEGHREFYRNLKTNENCESD